MTRLRRQRVAIVLTASLIVAAIMGVVFFPSGSGSGSDCKATDCTATIMRAGGPAQVIADFAGDPAFAALRRQIAIAPGSRRFAVLRSFSVARSELTAFDLP